MFVSLNMQLRNTLQVTVREFGSELFNLHCMTSLHLLQLFIVVVSEV